MADGGEGEAGISRAVHRLRAIEDPVRRAKAAAAELDKLSAQVSQVGLVRLEAIAELRAQSKSYDWIAAALGLTKERVAQLSRDAERYQASGKRADPEKATKAAQKKQAGSRAKKSR